MSHKPFITLSLSILLLITLRHVTYGRLIEKQRNILDHVDTCTSPHTLADGPKPYCYVPDTVSKEAQGWLAKAHTLELEDGFETNITAVEELRRFAGSAKGRLASKASQQYLASSYNSTIAGVPVVFWTPKGYKKAKGGEKLIIYLHGGGYIFNSCHTQLQIVAHLSYLSGIIVLCIEYRLAPEHPFPAGLHDALAVYKQLMKSHDASRITVLGDSAGGGMALALTIQLQRESVPVPAALVLFSPWVDLHNPGDTMVTLYGVDPALNAHTLITAAHMYVAGDRSKLYDPLVSPLQADYAALFPNNTFPATLLQLGTRDSLLSSSIMLFRKLKAAGQSNVVFSPWEAMWHDFEQHLDIPEARAAQEEAAEFITGHMSRA